MNTSKIKPADTHADAGSCDTLSERRKENRFSRKDTRSARSSECDQVRAAMYMHRDVDSE